MKKLPITVLMVTYKEEVHISHCLESVVGNVDEVVIVDNGSTDKTVEIAKGFGAKVVEVSHDMYKNQAQMFNWSLDNVEVKNDWIFRLDADEWVTENLWEELREKLGETPEDVSGYFIKRRAYFMGRWMKHGGYYPTWILRLFRKGKARYVGEREMDEHLTVLEGKTARLENDFADENRKSLEEWTDKHNDYSTREARATLEEKKKGLKSRAGANAGIYSKLPLFCRAFGYFIYRYFFRLGFLDGKKGLIYHFLQGFWYRFLVDAKIYEQKIKNGIYKG